MRVKDEIVQRLRNGHAYNRIASEVGCSKATVAYHAKQIGVAPGFKVHPWSEIQQYHDAGHCVSECLQKFDLCRHSWYRACASGKLVPRDSYDIPLETLMEAGRRTSRTHLKDRLLKAGALQAGCYECGLTEWRDKPLSLHLHHINGKGKDNRLEILQLLCPNCHSQTENYSGRNATKYVKKLNAG